MVGLFAHHGPMKGTQSLVVLSKMGMDIGKRGEEVKPQQQNLAEGKGQECICHIKDQCQLNHQLPGESGCRR